MWGASQHEHRWGMSAGGREGIKQMRHHTHINLKLKHRQSYTTNNETFENADVNFTNASTIIILNIFTDLHEVSSVSQTMLSLLNQMSWPVCRTRLRRLPAVSLSFFLTDLVSATNLCCRPVCRVLQSNDFLQNYLGGCWFSMRFFHTASSPLPPPSPIPLTHPAWQVHQYLTEPINN